MGHTHLTDEQWKKIAQFLKTCPGIHFGVSTRCRRFVEAVVWVSRSGAQWRFLPESYGKWNSVYKRYAGWCDRGVWQRMNEAFADDADFQQLIIDSTVVRAHPCAAGAVKKKGKQSLGRSRGGFTSKIHLATDALGNPVRVRLTPGQSGDAPQARPLIENIACECLIADKTYDDQSFIDEMAKRGVEVVIPARRNRRQPREHDREIDKERHLIECCINKMKQYRRVFSRFDKLDSRYLGFVWLVGSLIWLR